MRVFVASVDIAHDCTVFYLLNELYSRKLSIVAFVPSGPAGGNPNLTLAGSRQDLIDYLNTFDKFSDAELDQMITSFPR